MESAGKVLYLTSRKRGKSFVRKQWRAQEKFFLRKHWKAREKLRAYLCSLKCNLSHLKTTLLMSVNVLSCKLVW